MANSWIFQANPDRFDIDGFLSTAPDQFRWLVQQGANKMLPGDRVYIWRAIGSSDAKLSGVVAETEVIAPPAIQPDMPSATPFWLSGDPSQPSARVDLRTIRIALRDRLKRAWLEPDPILGGSLIFRLRTGTNFLLTAEEGERLANVWRRAGVDWDYAEAVAGLWAYWKTHGVNVSRLPGSPVSEAALRTGRVIGGMYNKVMNFRALDPADARAGLSATSVQDQLAWAKFDVTPVFHPAGTRDRRLSLRASAGEAMGWLQPAHCFSSSAANAAGVA